ncbi:GumC domain-containing protein [Mucisphaera calidilacus]|uniref:Uncharacterized protein n=1 Tax=Mucisphaera calidilacus TaxID=2527982 RepID=A0A518BYT9_9BACT|nr:hypothetical protein [Mucisphaera calidilacus]QDU72130.1 hypothetical protein Pan265_19930 [Mucisphaera calidilacus]
MTQPNEQQTAIFEMWSIVSRYRWRFILPCFGVMVAVMLVCLMLPRKYRSESVFEIRTDLVLKEMTARGATDEFQVPRSSVTEELSGEVAIDRLIRKIKPELRELGVVRSSFDLQQFRLNLLRRVTVRWDLASPQLDRVRVSYTGSNPEVTRLVVNNLVSAYIDQTNADMDQRLTESAAFFRREQERGQQTIEAIENRMLRFEIEHAALLPENPLNIQNQLLESRQDLDALIAERETHIGRLDALHAVLDAEPEMLEAVVMGNNPERAEVEAHKRELESQLSTNINIYRMREQHPDVVALKNQIDAAAERIKAIDQQVVTSRNLVQNPRHNEYTLAITRAEGELASVNDRIAAIRISLDALGENSAKLFPARSEYRKLERELAEARGDLSFWEANLRRVDLALAAENGDRGIQLAFVKRAGAAWKPVSPDLTQVLLACLLLGTLSGSLGVYLAYRTETAYHEGQKLASDLGIPLIGTVSEVISRQDRRTRRIRNLILYPTNAVVMAAVLLGLAGVLYLDLEKPHVLSLSGDEAIAQPEPSPSSAVDAVKRERE